MNRWMEHTKKMWVTDRTDLVALTLGSIRGSLSHDYWNMSESLHSVGLIKHSKVTIDTSLMISATNMQWQQLDYSIIAIGKQTSCTHKLIAHIVQHPVTIPCGI